MLEGWALVFQESLAKILEQAELVNILPILGRRQLLRLARSLKIRRSDFTNIFHFESLSRPMSEILRTLTHVGQISLMVSQTGVLS